MRRVGLIASLCAAAAAWLVGTAGADDTHTYEIEMSDAFGIVEGSNVRIAGVNAGEVKEIAINDAKRAVVTVELSGPLAELGEDTRCATEPQSLVAEYFIDCRPAGPPLAEDDDEDADIPASHVRQAVQFDLLQNALGREPFRARVQLVINQLGTGLAGNADNLREAIRLAVPTLTELRQTTRILARQRRALGALNVSAERVISRLAERRGDVVRTIQEARDAAAVAASRRGDLQRDVELLDDFTLELRPTLAELGETARAGTPLLAGLRAAAPGLARLAVGLPPFAGAAGDAIDALGEAAGPGRTALRHGRDEIEILRRAGRSAPLDAEILADLLRDLDDPGRTVEIDARAARTCDNRARPCWGTGRRAPTGYTGLESLLNYAYYQAGAINQFDSLGHILQFNVYDVGGAPCGFFNAGDTAPRAGGGRTTDILEADPCVAWLGANQPGLNVDLGLPRYDDSVCPQGSTDLSLCDPNVSTDGPGAHATGATAARAAAAARAPGAGAAPGGALPDGPPAPEIAPGSAPGGALGDLPADLVEDLLALPGESLPGGRERGPGEGRGGNQAVEDLLDFLFAP
jgi:ABC-type transporter Mla subunit MlaD